MEFYVCLQTWKLNRLPGTLMSLFTSRAEITWDTGHDGAYGGGDGAYCVHAPLSQCDEPTIPPITDHRTELQLSLQLKVHVYPNPFLLFKNTSHSTNMSLLRNHACLVISRCMSFSWFYTHISLKGLISETFPDIFSLNHLSNVTPWVRPSLGTLRCNIGLGPVLWYSQLAVALET